MMLALELVHRIASSPKVKTAEINETVDYAIAENDLEIEQLQRIVDEGTQLLRYDSDSLKRRLQELRNASRALQLENAKLSEELQDAAARREQVEKEKQTVTPERLKEEQQELQTAQRELQELKKSNRIIFNRPQGQSKTPWLLQIDGGGLLAAAVGKNAPPRRFASTQECIDWAKQNQNSRSIYFVLLVKPSGIERFNELRTSLRRAGFDMGHDALTKDQTAIHDETGAGVR
jgi:multidrug efflux pump subunit AcrA (membrane-fusion protein)